MLHRDQCAPAGEAGAERLLHRGLLVGAPGRERPAVLAAVFEQVLEDLGAGRAGVGVRRGHAGVHGAERDAFVS